MGKYTEFENIHQIFTPEKWFEVENIFWEIESKCFKHRHGDFDFISYFEQTLKLYNKPQKIAILKDLEQRALHVSNWSNTHAHRVLSSYLQKVEQSPTSIPDMPLVCGRKQTAVAELIKSYYLYRVGLFDFGSEKAFKEMFGNKSAYNAKRADKHTDRLNAEYLPLTKWVAEYWLAEYPDAQRIALQEISEAEKKLNKI